MPDFMIKKTGYNHKQIVKAFIAGIEFKTALEKQDAAKCKSICQGLELLQGDPDQ